MNTVLLVLVLCLIVAQTQCIADRSYQADTGEKKMAESPAQVLQISEDRIELVGAALTLARSKAPDDHKALGASLKSGGFLKKLDLPEDYQAPRDMLKLANVMKTLSENRAPSAREVLVSLTESPTYLGAASRIELLIDASVTIRPASPEIVKFWDKYCAPENAYPDLVIMAVLDNGTKPALELFEKKIADPAYEDWQRIDWMRMNVPPHRNDFLLLESCERLLAGGLPEHLRLNLVEVLFDFQPMWFLPDSEVAPAKLEQLGARGRVQLRKIGQYVLQNIKLTPEQKQAVENTLERLERKGSP